MDGLDINGEKRKSWASYIKTTPACFRVAPMPLHDADRLQNTDRLNSRPGQLATPVISNRVVHDINGRSQTSER